MQLQMGDEEARFTTAYKKPTTILDTTNIDKILDSLMNTIIFGDFNIKHTIWNISRINPAGNKLERYLSTRTDISIAAPGTPIYSRTTQLKIWIFWIYPS